MANPPRKKGTAGETELVRLLDAHGLRVRRTPASSTFDLIREGALDPYPVVEALATRPDRGRWLVTLRAEEFARLLANSIVEVHVEVKRYKRFSLHSLFERKFG
jgi:Holliday junction resolvase